MQQPCAAAGLEDSGSGCPLPRCLNNRQDYQKFKTTDTGFIETVNRFIRTGGRFIATDNRFTVQVTGLLPQAKDLWRQITDSAGQITILYRQSINLPG
jgi:hypothetical protein